MSKAPRGVEARLKWMKNNPPNKVGMCARTCWQALGGDYGNPPAWGAPHANSVYDKVKASGRWWDTGPIPRGALIIWKYGKYGHTALSLGGGRIRTTDPNGRPGKVGDESLTYPHRWGASASRRIWTDRYNGVTFPIGDEDMGLSDEDINKIAEKVARKVWMYEAPENSENKQRTQKMLREVWEKVTGKQATREPDDG